MKYLLVGLFTVFTALFPILANTSGSFRSLLARASPGRLFVGVAGDLQYNGTTGHSRNQETARSKLYFLVNQIISENTWAFCYLFEDHQRKGTKGRESLFHITRT